MKTQTDVPLEKEQIESQKTAAAPNPEQSVDPKGGSPANPAQDTPDMATLMAENEALKAKLEQLNDTYQRVLAEYANYKRRSEQEKEQVGLFTKCDVLEALLPTVDNFERAAAAPAGDDYKTGIEMIVAGFIKTLNQLGLEEIPAENQPFNPELHHAVAREDAPDVEVEMVTEVFQKGYTVGGRVIRPAMVKVANSL